MEEKTCLYCKHRMSCEKYVVWLLDPKDIFVPKAGNCDRYNKVNEEE